MKCLVTAGPSYEPLDQVRRLTNFSTGRLGTDLSLRLAEKGFQVLLLRGIQSTAPPPDLTGFSSLDAGSIDVQPFSTAASLGEAIHRASSEKIRGVFHAAAICDFRVGRMRGADLNSSVGYESAGKIPTERGPFWVELAPTEKILPTLRGLFPDAVIVGWKYEVDGSRNEALTKGTAQIASSRTDACVVNGPAYGAGFGLLRASGEIRHYETAGLLYEGLAELLG